jgi:hypothetical protein
MDILETNQPLETIVVMISLMEKLINYRIKQNLFVIIFNGESRIKNYDVTMITL